MSTFLQFTYSAPKIIPSKEKSFLPHDVGIKSIRSEVESGFDQSQIQARQHHVFNKKNFILNQSSNHVVPKKNGFTILATQQIYNQ